MAKKKSAPKKKAKAAAPVPVDAIKHKDSRTNIPTRELAAFAGDDERAPKTILYPLDPQLVWKGKDEQDQKPLAVPAVPIYIQEKIHPQALIEDMRRRAAKKTEQLDLFADFNGLDEFEKKVDFYHHDQHWSNRMILGDSLLVMTSLAEKERLKGRVQMIYLDPPYGIKFGSNWQVSTRKREVKDAKAEDVTRQPEQIKAFRDTWQLGIHSYLTYLRDRLVVARDLLTETGSIFVQIGDENVHLVRCVMDEVFGSENCVSLITFKKTTGQTAGYLAGTSDYIVWYAKNLNSLKYRALYKERELGDEGADAYTAVELADGTRRRLTPEEIANPRMLPAKAKPYRLQILQSQRQGRPSGPGSAMYFGVEFQGREYFPEGNRGWTTTQKGMRQLGYAGRFAVQGGSLSYVRYLNDFPAMPLNNLWNDTQSGSSMDKVYVVQTNTKVIERCLLMTTDPGDLILDPTCGSGTTAYVAEQWGWRWITIDTSRVALALARTRLMAAKFPYYRIAGEPADDSGGSRSATHPTEGRVGRAQRDPPSAAGCDIRRGFDYKQVPHITLKSIANNPDICKGMTRQEIDAAIRKHAETETLYDQPYEDKNVVRVSGPFTVESLSPHRMLPGVGWVAERDPPDFVQSILDNLRKAGVQNTVKNERLIFDRLDAFPGEYIQAEGTYSENGASKGVRVSVGPEFGTVGPEWIKQAALEAMRGSQCDLLLVCGFAFDPHVAEQTQELKKEMRFGKLPILPVRMNPDLAMGDELLKKTGSGNLFMVFGEPDIVLHKQKDGRLIVELRGLDVYDPTSGEVRSRSTDDIACWFLDADYNGESFFVRHAYFCGAEKPYEKLKKALRAEIDEAEWSKLYATRSQPFAAPKKGKLAVKVINHYGDEVLKVFGAASCGK